MNSGKNKMVFSYPNWTVCQLNDSGVHLLSASVSYFFFFFAFDGIFSKIHLPKSKEFVITFLTTKNISYLPDRKYRVGVYMSSDRLIEISSTENFNFPKPII